MPARKNTNRIANVIPSKDTQEDWSLSTAIGAGIMAAPAAPTPAPIG